MQIHVTLRKLGQFAKAPANGDARYGMLSQILQHPAGEVAHVQHVRVLQSIMRLHGFFRCRSRAAGDMCPSGCASNIYAAMNRVYPRRARIWRNNAGGAQNRKSAFNSEPAVPGFSGNFFAEDGLQTRLDYVRQKNSYGKL